MSGKPVSFSVVIPLYNKGPHVERAIRSVLEQDLQPTEIIVVDDASTDEGPGVVRGFHGVTMLERGRRGPGGYAARNAGIQAASGEWIAFLDADDCWRPDHLSALAAAITSHDGEVGCAFTRPAFVTDGSPRDYPISRIIRDGSAPVDLRGFLAAWLDAKTCPMWTGAVAIRRSVLLAAGLFPADAATRGGDKDLWLRVMALTNAIFVPRITTEFHQDTVNRVTSSLDHSVQPIICRSITRLLPSAPPETRRLLRRLNNMEVVFYARYAAGAGARFNRESLRTLLGPALRSALQIVSFATVGELFRLLRSGKATRVSTTPSGAVALAAQPTPADHQTYAQTPGGIAGFTALSQSWLRSASNGSTQRREEDLPARISA